jgi:hypothetical protein
MNSVALVRERTIPTERPQLVGEVSVNFCGQKVSHDQRNGYPRPYSRFSRPETGYIFCRILHVKHYNAIWQNAFTTQSVTVEHLGCVASGSSPSQATLETPLSETPSYLANFLYSEENKMILLRSLCCLSLYSINFCLDAHEIAL